MVRLTDRPDMTLDCYRGRKTTTQTTTTKTLYIKLFTKVALERSLIDNWGLKLVLQAPEFRCCYFCGSSCLFYLSFNLPLSMQNVALHLSYMFVT